MIHRDGKRQKLLRSVILALEMLFTPLCARASPLSEYMPDSWMKEYMNLLPWIKRISVLLVITGAVKMMKGYGEKGVYGIAGGVASMIAGGILYVVCV